MKAWITKHALTTGIIEVDGERFENSQSFHYHHGPGTFLQSAYGEGKEWHKTKEEAISRAEEMRTAKIKSLEKSIKKLTAMKFE